MPIKAVLRWLCAVLLTGLVSACASSSLPGDAPVPDGAKVTHRAVFIGENYHDTVGTISLYMSDEAPVIVFEPNFRIDGVSEAEVQLGFNGYRARTTLGALARMNGRQSYAFPEGLRGKKYNEVWLWSRTKNVALGLARLVPILDT